MTKPALERKLTAIFSADVKGYSILMADDEEATIHTITEYRGIMSSLIERYKGRVVDSPGDNLLAEFKSAVNAVQCAVEIQKALHKENELLPKERRMIFRIGINIGDIAQEGNRIYGDGVNIAARIEGISVPGGVCISRNVYDHVKKKLNFGYEYIGEHTVKNISDPVRVYKVLMDTKDAGKRIKSEPNPSVKKSWLKKWLRIMASIILILSAVLAGVYWKYIYLPAPTDIDPQGKMEFNLPEGPSIAVLPFVNMSKDPEQEYLCDGMTENIISVLAQTQQVITIAPRSIFAYKDKIINVQKIGNELDVQYVIKGSIQKSINKIRISVQLIDTNSGRHIWAERYDREFQDIFNLQDEITLEILKTVGIKLTSLGNYSNIMEGLTDINSFIKIGKHMGFVTNPTREGYTSALKNAKELIALNPEYPYRYDILAFVHVIGVLFGSCESVEICLFKASDLVKKSLSLNENNYLVHLALGWLFTLKKEHDNAIISIKRSIKLNSINADAYWTMGFVLNYSDRPSKALESMKIAIRLNPVPQANYLYTFGLSYRLLGQYEKAIEMYKKCLKLQADYLGAYSGLIVAYSLSGQKKKAKTTVRQLLNLSPNFSIGYVKKASLYKNKDQLDRVIKAVRNAGLPE